MFSYFETKEGVYVPRDPRDFPTDDAHKHLVKVKPTKGDKARFRFDETYPYIDHSLSYRLQRWVVAPLVLWLFIFPANRLIYGLKIEGRRKLWRHRKLLRKGVVAVCNHVYQFDAMAVKQAVTPLRRLWIPMYAKHFNGSQYWAVRYSGGIPVPETRGGMKMFDQAFDQYHAHGDTILVFPEEVRWDWYAPVRPFRKGAFTMAWKYGTPLVPCAITFRRRKGIYRLFGRKEMPTMTIHVGDLIMPDPSKPRREEVARLRQEAHDRIVALAGITHNPWQAVPDDELRAASAKSNSAEG